MKNKKLSKMKNSKKKMEYWNIHLPILIIHPKGAIPKLEYSKKNWNT